LPLFSLIELLPVQIEQDILQIQEQDIQQTLDDLHSILNIPEDMAQLIRLHHPSFRDFLLSSERCGDDFWVDDRYRHWVLAQKRLQLMSTLKLDICGLCSPSVLVSDIDTSQVKKHLRPEVQYARLYWIPHILKSGNQLRDAGPVHEFSKKQFLHWLEAMALIGKTTEGMHAIAALESSVKHQKSSSVKHHRFIPTAMRAFFNKHIKNEKIHAFVYDTKRFTLFNQSLIRDTPLQIYCSALLFAPEASDNSKTKPLFG
jgi:hypothetical protein